MGPGAEQPNITADFCCVERKRHGWYDKTCLRQKLFSPCRRFWRGCLLLIFLPVFRFSVSTGQTWEGKFLMPSTKAQNSELLIGPTPSGSKLSLTFWENLFFLLRILSFRKQKGLVAPSRQAQCGRLRNQLFENMCRGNNTYSGRIENL